MAWGLAAPAAVSALLTMAAGITGIDVSDGPQFNPTKPKALIIGYGDPDTDAITHQLGDPGYSSELSDQFTIICRVEVPIGTDMSAARTDAYGLLNTFAGRIVANPTLSGAVMQASIAGVAYAPVMHEKRGYLATVHFGVVCDAYTGV